MNNPDYYQQFGSYQTILTILKCTYKYSRKKLVRLVGGTSVDECACACSSVCLVCAQLMQMQQNTWHKENIRDQNTHPHTHSVVRITIPV